MSKRDKTNYVFKMISPQKINKSRAQEVNSKTTFTENPLAMLSIKNYDLICKNDEIKKKMASFLKIKESKLTEYCKDINTFSNYIDSKLRTNKEKEIAKLSPINELSPELLSGMSAKAITFLDIPQNIVNIIKNKYEALLENKLAKWMPPNKLSPDFVSANLNAIDFLSLPENRRLISWHVLSENPNAVEFLSLPENKKHIFYHYLSCNTNPMAIKLLEEYIKENPEDRKINWKVLSKNPYATKILKENYDRIYWIGLSSNPNPDAIKFLLSDKNIDFVKWSEFSCNSGNNAIKFLKENPDYIDWDGLSGNTNPKAIPLLKKKIQEENKLSLKEYDNLLEKVNWRKLSANPHAIDLIIDKIKVGIGLDKIDWNALSANTAIFSAYTKYKYAKSRIIGRILSSNLPKKDNAKIGITDLPEELHDKIVKKFISISINKLKDGIPVDKLNWSYLCKNPNAIDLIRERMNIEKNLSKDDYDRLPYKINWSALCSNSDPGAIELLNLEENYEKIDWLLLSSNPNAIQLLEKRVKYQLSLNPNIVHNLSIHKRINWQKISGNPGIFIPK